MEPRGIINQRASPAASCCAAEGTPRPEHVPVVVGVHLAGKVAEQPAGSESTGKEVPGMELHASTGLLRRCLPPARWDDCWARAGGRAHALERVSAVERIIGVPRTLVRLNDHKRRGADEQQAHGARAVQCADGVCLQLELGHQAHGSVGPSFIRPRLLPQP